MKEKTSPWFKVLALCTAVGLGGTYVWRQQQKAAAQVEKPVERTVLSGSKSAVIAPPNSPVDEKKTNLPATQQESEVKERVMMPGSKSSDVFRLEQEERILLPSSKSITMPIFRERHPAPADQPKPADP